MSEDAVGDENSSLLPKEGEFTLHGGAKPAKKSLSTFGLIVLGFFWVSGAELACAMPWEGGPVAWTEEAFGHTIGGHNAYWTWLSYTMDASLYPRFAARYIASLFDLPYAFEGIFSMAIVACVTIAKTRGTKTLINVETAIGVLAVLPTIFFLMVGVWDIDLTVISDTSGEDTDWSSLLTWALWLYGGVVSFGSVAAEVENPRSAYLTAVYILLIIDIMLINFTPLLVSLSLDRDRTKYEAGHFAALGGQIGGEWLEVMLTLGAQISQIGIYGSMSMAADRYLASLVHSHSGATLEEIKMRHPTSVALIEDGMETGVPRVFILLNATVHMCLVWLPIVETLKLSVILDSITTVLFLLSFVRLKFTRPDLRRDYETPGGKMGGVLIALPCFAVTLTNVILALFTGAHWTEFVFLASVFGVGLCVHGLWVVCGWGDSRSKVP